MQSRLLAMIGAIVGAALLAAAPAFAQEQATQELQAPVQAPAQRATIPRSYPASSFSRARPDKPAAIVARETADADTHAAACDTGDLAACTMLGNAFERGEGRPQNRPVAELLYRRACGAAVGDGCFRLGQLLETTDEPSDKEFAAIFIARACAAGSLDGCNAEADNLAVGVLGPADPLAAGALRRTTCDSGGWAACRVLAARLIRDESTAADRDAGRALIDRQCRAGDPDICETAASHWRRLIAPDAAARFNEYQQLGCASGSASLCADLGFAEFAAGRGEAGRAAALALFDRACLLDPRAWEACEAAANLREEPRLTAQCGQSDFAACIALGTILTTPNGVLLDRLRALTVLGSACEVGAESGAAVACQLAAELVFYQWNKSGIADPEQAEYYLDRGCSAGDARACRKLAAELASGAKLPEDQARAAILYAGQCDAGSRDACDFLEERSRDDPTSPLMLAQANFGAELTPEEEAQERQQRREERERERAEFDAMRCTTTTVVFDGVSYSDTVCDPVSRVIGLGFAARVGEAPWQALLWRPAVLGRQQLTAAQRVMCGGTVIRDGWILTAAHCLTDKGGVSIVTAGHKVRLGLNNPLSDEGFSYPILRTIRHPDFKRGTLAFDIALVQYDPARGVRGTGRVISPARIRLDPLALDQRKLSAVQRVTTYGWGVTKVDTGNVPDHLRGARLKLRDTAACTADTRFEDAERRDSVICADDSKGAEGGQACDGDSGGALITYGDADRVPTVIGVVSGGVKCGTAKRPSRYIRVAHPKVQAWLRSHLPGISRR